MGADTTFDVPIQRWDRGVLKALLEHLQQALEPEVEIELDDDSYDDLALIITERGASGRLRLSHGEQGAHLFVDHQEVDDRVLETVGRVVELIVQRLSGPGALAPDAAIALGSFDEVRSLLAEEYGLNSAEDGQLSVVQAWDGTDRSQLVVVSLEEMLDEPWIALSSRVCPQARLPLESAVAISSEDGLAKLSLVDGFYDWQMVVPLGGLTAERLLDLVSYVAEIADNLEEELTGRDEH